MPKPVLPDDLEPDMRAGTAARRIIIAKLEELLLYLKPALDGDFDGIHDMRVAVKRLREALRLFRPLIRKRRRRHVVSMTGRLNDALGAVRERDVLISDGRRIMARLPDATDLLEGLVEERGREREMHLEAFRELWAELDGSENFLHEARRAARAAHRRSGDLNDMPLERFAYPVILARLDPVMTALEAARGSDEAHPLHQLRIAVKKLRYAMEPFRPIFPGLKKPGRVAAELQEALGLAHDYDVLLAALQDYFERNGVNELPEAGEVLELVRAERAARYAEAHDSIAQLDADVWRRRLLDAID
ncbi:MAG: CHAD domain-containing protein [Armatimonadetes bacterium]|nr:CHAD domain-containing protein [Armatimonadota bacterium]